MNEESFFANDARGLGQITTLPAGLHTVRVEPLSPQYPQPYHLVLRQGSWKKASNRLDNTRTVRVRLQSGQKLEVVKEEEIESYNLSMDRYKGLSLIHI